MTVIRLVAVGDSFTEGVGDERADGSVRGWADLVAEGWADSIGEPVSYANLAIRGRLIAGILAEQLEPALALRPTHLSFNGGGNDLLRPRTSIAEITAAFAHTVRRCDEEGVQLLVLSGGNPSAQLPLPGLIQRRGDALAASVEEMLSGRDDVLRAWNWPDRELARPEFWSADRLHMNPRGHHRVAARVLGALGQHAPEEWWRMPAEDSAAEGLRGVAYYREHVGPWVRRRLTGRSSGDGRTAKLPEWTTVRPAAA